jgi:DNA-binding Lrp family transcriptional regulator
VNIDSDALRGVACAMEEGLPLAASPFSGLAERLGAPVAMVLSLARELLDRGLIRRFGAFWDFRRFGQEGYLFGVRVPAGDLDGIALWINGFDCVTHNYARRHDLNLWFTAVLPGDGAAALFGALLAEKKLSFVSLGVRRMIKLRPSFAGGIGKSPNEGGGAYARAAPACRTVPQRRPSPPSVPAGEAGVMPNFACSSGVGDLTPLRRKIIAALQDDLKITERPFTDVADRLKIEEDALIEELVKLKSSGALRRVGASVVHSKAGCLANSLMAWDFSSEADGCIAEAAEGAVRGRDWASHCYLRHVVLSNLAVMWPYNLFVMIHARDGAELADREESLSGAFAPAGFVSMRTRREYKKIQYRLTV